ncbi:MAG: lytic transglycosylase, partial [Azovibrio sp.]
MKLRVFLVGLCLASSLAGVTHSQTVPGDEQFLAVRDAFRLGNRLQLEVLSGQLEGHVLADYGEYYLLRNNLDKQNPDDVLAFIERQAGNYLGERLRADWMRVLAKKGDWGGVSQHFAQLKAPDQESKCLDIQARFNLQEPSALAEGEILWTSLTPVPEECQPLMGMMAN